MVEFWSQTVIKPDPIVHTWTINLISKIIVMLQPVEIYSGSMQLWRVNSAFASACKLVLKTQWRMMRLEKKIASRALGQRLLAR